MACLDKKRKHRNYIYIRYVEYKNQKEKRKGITRKNKKGKRAYINHHKSKFETC